MNADATQMNADENLQGLNFDDASRGTKRHQGFGVIRVHLRIICVHLRSKL
jgi:hypothetical protein